MYVPTERAPAPGPPGGRTEEPAAEHDGGEPPGRTGAERGLNTVFLPTRRVRPGDAEFTVELRTLEDGRLALLTYSSLESLVECCGAAQPWVEVETQRVEYVVATVEAEAVLVDTPLEEDVRHTDTGGVQ